MEREKGVLRATRPRTPFQGEYPPGGGALNFFQVRVCGPDEVWGLQTDFLSLKERACELKFSNFRHES